MLANVVQTRQGVGPDLLEPHRHRASYDTLNLVRQPVTHCERQRFVVQSVCVTEVPAADKASAEVTASMAAH